MEQYLKLFKTQADYESASDKPTVSHIVEEVEVIMPEKIDYENEYLTFIAIDDCKFKYGYSSGYSYYSLDGGNTWTYLRYNTETPLVRSGEKIMWKSYSMTSGGFPILFSSSGKYKAEGNILSMQYADDFIGQTTMGSSTRYCSFKDGIVDAENLVLPCLTLGDSACNAMFFYATDLVTAPKVLPATTIGVATYNQMFDGCTSLVNLPKIEATTLTGMQSFHCMFSNCTSITETPDLPMTSLTQQQCYWQMFAGCTSLRKVKNLPATVLSSSCYKEMFKGCTSLEIVPDLKAEIINDNSYSGMFSGCTSLVNAPKIEATGMTGSWNCSEMFEECTSLETAPELLSKRVTARGYDRMFKGCTNLKYIKCHAETFDTYALAGWVQNVSASGTFVKKANVNYSSGISGIPEGWTIENI